MNIVSRWLKRRRVDRLRKDALLARFFGVKSKRLEEIYKKLDREFKLDMIGRLDDES